MVKVCTRTGRARGLAAWSTILSATGTSQNKSQAMIELYYDLIWLAKDKVLEYGPGVRLHTFTTKAMTNENTGSELQLTHLCQNPGPDIFRLMPLHSITIHKGNLLLGQYITIHALIYWNLFCWDVESEGEMVTYKLKNITSCRCHRMRPSLPYGRWLPMTPQIH